MQFCLQLVRQRTGDAGNQGLDRKVLAAIACGLCACSPADSLADRCLTEYPSPGDTEIVSTRMPLPEWESLPLYRPSDSLPQIYTADSSTTRFRNLFYARLNAFRSDEEIASFIGRFQARVVGRAVTNGWYAVMIPDPGPDTSNFRLLEDCIGVSYGVYVRSAYAHQFPFFVGDTVNRELGR